MVPAADSGMVKADAGSTPSAFCTVREGLNPVNAPESGGVGNVGSGPIQGVGARRGNRRMVQPGQCPRLSRSAAGCRGYVIFLCASCNW